MFIIDPNPAPETHAALKLFEQRMGTVPPHFELLATVNPERFKLFINEVLYLAGHKRIDPLFFAFMRLFIATKEGFDYCIAFNTRLLRAQGYDPSVLSGVTHDFNTIPLDARHKILGEKALKAVYHPEAFTSEDIDALKTDGWNDADIYDAVDHAAFLFKNAKILKAYSRPPSEK